VGGLARRRLTDQNEPRAGRLELLPSAIQLDRVLLAENSAVVTQPYERRRSLPPEVSETHVIAVVVRQHDVGKGVGACRRLRPLPSRGRA
jgi:hypothetical protein